MGTVADRLRALLPSSPDAYPQNLDAGRGRVLVIRFDAAAYRAASFLDDRILGPATQGAWFTEAAVVAAAGAVAAPRPLHFIFHAGHAGSTLLSRLLDETGTALGLREPLPLRTLADLHDALALPAPPMSPDRFARLREAMMRLWSRGYDSTEAVVVKATSVTGRMAVPLLEAIPASRAVYLNLRAESYLATLLAGANSPLDLRGHAPSRLQRLAVRFGASRAPSGEMSLGELAALGWVAESLSQRDALQGLPGRVLALDFEALLADVAGSLDRVLSHFGLAAGPGGLERLCASRVLQHYSKAPDIAYEPGDRVAALAQTRREQAREIARGLAWIERLARAEPEVAELLAAEPA